MAPVGRLYRRTMWRTIWRTMWRGLWRTVWRGIWRTIWRSIGAPTWLGYGVWLAPMAYGWRLWRAGCGSCGRSTACGCRLCVVPMCRHGCAYMPTWLRLYADMVAWLWRERVRLDGVSV